MIVYPAIDLRGGVCVRLMQGRFDEATTYDDQPPARLAVFAAGGAEWVHIVDLDGAEAGEARQHTLIGELAQAVDLKIQSGGGVRAVSDVEALLDAGVDRVVVGSLAASQPETVLDWLDRFGPERLTLAFDVRIENGVPTPALKGWTQSSGLDLFSVLDRYPVGRIKHVLVTDVSRDGALTGPNLELLSDIRLRRPDLVLQASGGVATLDDITAIKALGCHGVIVGRAIYEGRFTLPDAITAARRERD